MRWHATAAVRASAVTVPRCDRTGPHPGYSVALMFAAAAAAALLLLAAPGHAQPADGPRAPDALAAEGPVMGNAGVTLDRVGELVGPLMREDVPLSHCWEDADRRLRCLPGLFVLGAPKSGTTDLSEVRRWQCLAA